VTEPALPLEPPALTPPPALVIPVVFELELAPDPAPACCPVPVELAWPVQPPSARVKQKSNNANRHDRVSMALRADPHRIRSLFFF
jgi:hypothetical protein